MSFATVASRAIFGIRALPVNVEAHLFNGLPKFTIVGLPEKAVKESKDRVRSAIMMSGFEFLDQKVTVNLAPADLPKEGGRFDLAIAIGILLASRQLPDQKIEQYELIGELALSGELRAVNGVLPSAIAAKKANRILVLPKANADEAALVSGLQLLPITHLLEISAHFTNHKPLSFYQTAIPNLQPRYPDLKDVKGQPFAKRALEVAAAGGHSCLFSGPPGSGKTMLAKRLPGLLPALTLEEGYEVAAILSMNKPFDVQQWLVRPYRSPHHSASAPALVGGGNPPKPGEISLAHHGVLFLDELPEFHRHVLEMLREPLETGSITISRAAHQLEFPAKFQMIAAMNPCPCGYLGDPNTQCDCTTHQIQRYRKKLSGPFLDRIDIQICVPRLSLQEMDVQTSCETSAEVAERVLRARALQIKRQGKVNAVLSAKAILQFCVLTKKDKAYLIQLLNQFHLSARAYHRVLKLARTIADLKSQEAIVRADLSEAFQLRRGLDRVPGVG